MRAWWAWLNQAGSYELFVKFTPTDTTDYNSATAYVLLTVTKAPLTVTVNSASFTYGGLLPAFSGSVSGLVNGDTLGNTVKVAYSSTGTATSNAALTRSRLP